jgi:two-component system sensor histidine kinase KdpD
MVAVVVVSLTVGAAFLADRIMPHSSLSLLFLTGVLIVSVRTGLGPSLAASVLSFLSYNFFFTSPYYTFEVADDSDVATLVFFLLMAAITGNLAARMHREVAERRVSLQRISNLYDFSRRMSTAVGTEQVLASLADHLSKSMDRPVAVLIADIKGVPVLRATAGGSAELPETAINTAWLRESREVIKAGGWCFLKLFTNNAPVGMVAIFGEAGEDEQTNLARSLCDQAAPVCASRFPWYNPPKETIDEYGRCEHFGDRGRRADSQISAHQPGGPRLYRQ